MSQDRVRESDIDAALRGYREALRAHLSREARSARSWQAALHALELRWLLFWEDTLWAPSLLRLHDSLYTDPGGPISILSAALGFDDVGAELASLTAESASLRGLLTLPEAPPPAPGPLEALSERDALSVGEVLAALGEPCFLAGGRVLCYRGFDPRGGRWAFFDAAPGDGPLTEERPILRLRPPMDGPRWRLIRRFDSP